MSVALTVTRPNRRSIVAGVVSIVAATALVMVTGAEGQELPPASFPPPQPLVSDGLTLQSGHVAMGPTGRAAVLVSSLDSVAGIGGLQLQRIEADGTAGPVTTLVSPSGTSRVGYAALAVDSSDRAIVVWGQGPGGFGKDPNEVDAAVVEPDGTAGPTQRLLGGGVVGDVQLGITPSGAGQVACDCPRGLETVTLDAQANPMRVAVVDPLGDQGPKGSLRRPVAPRIAVARDGSATITWNVRRKLSHGGFRLEVHAAHVAAGGRKVGKAVRLSGPREDASGAEVAADAQGYPVVSWRRSDRESIVIQPLTRSGEPTGRQTLKQPKQTRVYGPRIAIDGSGERFITWRTDRSKPSYRATVEFADFSRTGRAEPATVFSTTRSRPQQADVAVDDAHHGLVVWSGDGIYAAAVAAGGRTGPPTLVSGAGALVEYPVVAANADGAASIVFVHRIGDQAFAPTELEESRSQIP